MPQSSKLEKSEDSNQTIRKPETNTQSSKFEFSNPQTNTNQPHTHNHTASSRSHVNITCPIAKSHFPIEKLKQIAIPISQDTTN